MLSAAYTHKRDKNKKIQNHGAQNAEKAKGGGWGWQNSNRNATGVEVTSRLRIRGPVPFLDRVPRQNIYGSWREADVGGA